MKLRLTLLVACVLTAIPLGAQDMGQLYQNAIDAFNMGDFEKVESLFEGNVDKLEEKEQVQAYRMLALGNLYRDRTDKAKEYAKQLLLLDPFYTSYSDSPRFLDMLSVLKKQSSTVTTASKIAESIEEVPVPVTLITKDMIKASGATRLQDVLKLYVPGLNEISGLEDNVAMRGIYGLGQETILVLLDGHRLNSQSTNSESFDFRNSLDKLKQIEVLRGPASSLYGNVALTAVVNLITESGGDVDGVHVSGLTGNNSTYGATIMLGSGNIQSDYMIWASIYKSQGEEVIQDRSKHYIGGYLAKPAFDLGVKLHWGDISFEAIGQHAHPVPYYNLLSLTDAFTYDSYGKVNGEGPGMARTNMRTDVEWAHTWNNYTLSASLYGSSERMQIYNVLGDEVPYAILQYLAQGFGLTEIRTKGTRQIISWDDYSFGGMLTNTWNYSLRNGMNGSALLGFQSEDLLEGDATLLIGADFTNTNNVRHAILVDGAERTLSAFFQMKHYFTDKFILNGGFRYDNKKRILGKKLNTVSPRVSLIWQPNQLLTLKGAYSHAFVDAATFYRGSTISIFSGGEGLDPEIMDAFQAGAIFNFSSLGLKYEMNAFYNKVRDMVYYNTKSLGSIDSTSGRRAFYNAGHICMAGLENTLQLNRDRLFANVNFTCQYPVDIAEYGLSDEILDNVPHFLGNAVASYMLYAPKDGGRLSVRGNVHFQSSFNSTMNDILALFITGTNDTYHEDGYAVFGAGVEWKGTKGLNLSLDLSNLTNKEYQVGGQLLDGVPGQGRSIIFKVGYDFSLNSK